MGVLVDANKAWKQAQQTMAEVKLYIWRGVHQTGEHTPAVWYGLALGKLIHAKLTNTITRENAYHLDAQGVQWYIALKSELYSAIMDENKACGNTADTEQRKINYAYMFGMANIGWKSQVHALPHFEKLAKQAYHDRMFAEAKREVELTAGSPLEREASKINEDDHTYNFR